MQGEFVDTFLPLMDIFSVHTGLALSKDYPHGQLRRVPASKCLNYSISIEEEVFWKDLNVS